MYLYKKNTHFYGTFEKFRTLCDFIILNFIIKKTFGIRLEVGKKNHLKVKNKSHRGNRE